MSEIVTMTPELAREWLEDTSKVPACWQPIFTADSKSGKRRRMLITAFADGFYLESDGETVTAPMTPKMFTRYAHAICAIMVCTPNPDVEQLKLLIASAEKNAHLRSEEQAAKASFLQASRRYLGVLPDYRYMTLNYHQYLSFYATGAKHAIRATNVQRAFFSRFPQAQSI